MKVLLVCMPWCDVRRPLLGLSLLKAGLRKRSIRCDIFYGNIVWAEMLQRLLFSNGGPRLSGRVARDDIRYDLVRNTHFDGLLLGEWAFSQNYYDRHDGDESSYPSVLQRQAHIDEEKTALWQDIRRLAPSFLERCFQAVSWAEYDAVGFTLMFEQIFASLCLARRIKQSFPKIAVVFGGASAEGSMGAALLRNFDCIDYAVTGEGDNAFPELLLRINSGQAPVALAGVVGRQQGGLVPPGRDVVYDLDSLPFPDFDDYFLQLQQSALVRDFRTRLSMEQSRGCWWGVKSHCTFCGLNGLGMAYRSKSAARSLAELEYLTERYKTRQISFTDNILDIRNFRDFFPAVIASGRKYEMFYEMKSNVTKAQIATLAGVGVRKVQPGIESLSSRVLRLMRKGVSSLQNLQCLKWCKEFGIRVIWNILYGFPGEAPEDYAELLQLIQKIPHLDCPVSVNRIQVHRFSPNFDRAEEFGFTNLRPIAAYRHIFHLPERELFDIAYFFDHDFTLGDELESRVQEIRAAVAGWRAVEETGQLQHLALDGGEGIIADTRCNSAGGYFHLDRLMNRAYLFCDSIQSSQGVENHLRSVHGSCVSARLVEDMLNQFIDAGIMAREADRFLALATLTASDRAQDLAPPGPAHWKLSRSLL